MEGTLMGKKPKQADLPGMEDREIKELQSAARRYAEIRDERMALTPKEVDLKQTLLRLMKQHHKQIYRHDGIEVRVVTEEETVRVKIEAKDKEQVEVKG
jgi:hypothetical protein